MMSSAQIYCLAGVASSPCMCRLTRDQLSDGGIGIHSNCPCGHPFHLHKRQSDLFIHATTGQCAFTNHMKIIAVVPIRFLFFLITHAFSLCVCVSIVLILGPQLLPSTDSFTSFITSLLASEPTTEGLTSIQSDVAVSSPTATGATTVVGEVLTLPDGISLFGLSSRGSKLYIRSCYKLLLTAINKLFDNFNVLVNGTEGVGAVSDIVFMSELSELSLYTSTTSTAAC